LTGDDLIIPNVDTSCYLLAAADADRPG